MESAAKIGATGARVPPTPSLSPPARQPGYCRGRRGGRPGRAAPSRAGPGRATPRQARGRGASRGAAVPGAPPRGDAEGGGDAGATAGRRDSSYLSPEQALPWRRAPRAAVRAAARLSRPRPRPPLRTPQAGGTAPRSGHPPGGATARGEGRGAGSGSSAGPSSQGAGRDGRRGGRRPSLGPAPAPAPPSGRRVRGVRAPRCPAGPPRGAGAGRRATIPRGRELREERQAPAARADPTPTGCRAVPRAGSRERRLEERFGDVGRARLSCCFLSEGQLSREVLLAPRAPLLPRLVPCCGKGCTGTSSSRSFQEWRSPAVSYLHQRWVAWSPCFWTLQKRFCVSTFFWIRNTWAI